MNRMGLKNKVVIITGASSGIGKACVQEFSARGCKVVLAARNQQSLQQIAETLGGEYLIVATDVSKEEECKTLIDKTIEKFGKIDILINNAGISQRTLFIDLHLDVIRQIMDVNFWGTVYCTKYALPHILKQKGSIVGVSSVAGYKGLPGRTGYSASKYAMQGLLDTIRIEHLKDDLHVLVVCPGFTVSNIRVTALVADGSEQGESPRDEQKMMPAETVAKRMADAVAKRKRTLTLTMQAKSTVFFNKWMPAWVDKMVYNHLAKENNTPLK